MDFLTSIDERVNWIRGVIKGAGAKGIVLGMSGGKDCALVGILSKKAIDNVTGVIMPCDTQINYFQDMKDALRFNEMYGIETQMVDLTPVKKVFRKALEPIISLQPEIAYENMNPRLRMIALYNYAQRMGYLVAGTGNLSERTVGYFTKWGDGAYDLNPIGDLTVTEIYQMLEHLGCPDFITKKAPSAGLYEGQTDEQDIGLPYSVIDGVIRGRSNDKVVKDLVNTMKTKTQHKREMGRIFPN